MKIEILGTGCSKCKLLEELVEVTVKESGMNAVISKVTEIEQIASRGVFSTPGLIIDGKLKSSGRVPTLAEIKGFLAQEK
jgi:small redox-active disulfide protein 2